MSTLKYIVLAIALAVAAPVHADALQWRQAYKDSGRVDDPKMVEWSIKDRSSYDAAKRVLICIQI